MLKFIVIAGTIFAGWLLASTFTTAVLIAVTILGISFLVSVRKDITSHGLDGIPHMLVLVSFSIFFVSIWIFWYLVNNLEFATRFFHDYILR